MVRQTMLILLKPAKQIGRILSQGKFICRHISTTNQKMDKITEMELETVSSSRWLQPRRLKYKQDGVAKTWDMLQSNGSVVSVVYNESSDSLVMVKQFRPAVLVCKAIKDSQGSQLSGTSIFSDVSMHMLKRPKYLQTKWYTGMSSFVTSISSRNHP